MVFEKFITTGIWKSEYKKLSLSLHTIDRNYIYIINSLESNLN